MTETVINHQYFIEINVDCRVLGLESCDISFCYAWQILIHSLTVGSCAVDFQFQIFLIDS